jgi:hypothetical protein
MRNGGLREVLKGVRTAQGLAAEPLQRLAWGLLVEFFARETDAVSRRNTIIEVSQRLGLGGPDRRAASRTLAEGWQLLENQGLICRDPEQLQGDWWFLTRAGRSALEREDLDVLVRAALDS